MVGAPLKALQWGVFHLIRTAVQIVAQKSPHAHSTGYVRNEAWLSCRTSSGVRLCWELEEPKGLKGAAYRGRSTGSRGQTSAPDNPTKAAHSPAQDNNFTGMCSGSEAVGAKLLRLTIRIRRGHTHLHQTPERERVSSLLTTYWSESTLSS